MSSASVRHRVARVLLVCAAQGACTIEPPEDDAPAPLVNVCDVDSDCPAGRCDVSVGHCSRQETDFRAVLLEVVPPQSDVYGGRQFYQRVNIDAASPLEVVLEPREVPGTLTLWLGNCFGHSILFSLRSRVEALGLRPNRLAVESATLPRVKENGDYDYSVRLNRFNLGTVPPGVYDVYLRDTGSEVATPECPAPAVPQLSRGFLVSTDSASTSYLHDQTNPEPVELVVTVPFRPELEGWTVDVVHNITGERISTQGTLTAASAVEADSGRTVTVAIRYARVVGSDYRIPSASGVPFPTAVVRLRPPELDARPTVYFAGLLPTDAVVSAPIAIPEIALSEPIPYRAWVWGEGDPTIPIRGRVLLQADRLSDIDAGVTLSMLVDLLEDGSFEAMLLPGEYWAEVVPEAGSGFGRYRTRITVWARQHEGDAGTPQAGRALAVPSAPVLSGRIRGPADEPATGTRVRTQASVRGGFTLTAQVSRFQPRPNESIIDASGRFETELDCSWCSDESSVAFDFLVRPPESSGLPWRVFRDVPVTGDVNLGRAALEVPRLLVGSVSFRNRPGQPTAVYAGPLVRAYAMIDQSGDVVTDPALPDCVDLEPSATTPESSPCVQRVIQIGEATTDRTGRFQLPLPTAFGRVQ